MKTLNSLILLVGILLIGHSAYAQPNFEWANQISSNSSDLSYQIVADNGGNTYQIGLFSGTVDFDPGPGIFNMTEAGNTDIYIRKLDSNGNLIWAKQIGGNVSQEALSITIDHSGNVVLTGNFGGTIDFDPGSGVNNLTSNGGNDAFILKLTSSGDFIWVRQMGSTTNSESGRYIITDSDNNIYSAGQFNTTVDFDPGVGTFNLNSSAAVYETYIQKLDSNGNFLWVKQIASTYLALVYSMEFDINNDLCMVGTFSGTADFDPGIGTVNYTSTNYDIFILKLDTNGTYQWAKQIGSGYTDNGFSISTDNNANLYITGSFGLTVDFDPGTGTFNMTSNGGLDAYLVKLDVNGNFKWAKQFGGLQSDIGQSLAVSNNGKIYCTGRFKDVVDFDPNAGVYNLTSNGNYDIYTLSLDTAGNFEWATGIGGTDLDLSYSIALGNNGSVYTSGYFNVTVDFDPTPGVFNLTAPLTYYDGFVQKLSICNSASNGTDIITACTSHQWIDGNTYTSNNNTATHTIINGAASGCDSIVTLNLTINNATSGTDIVTACNSYTWIDNNTYTASTTSPTHTITGGAANGCDSIVTLNLTINNATSGTDIVTACDSYMWIDNNTYTTSTTSPTHTITGGAANGCDSIVTLNLTINNATSGTDIVTACDSYMWIDNNTYTTSTTSPTHTITGGATNGCDSIVTLNLTINSVDATTTNSNDSIIANASSATYQWLDCDNNYEIIAGATSQLFVASTNGNYAVSVTQNNCTDTSTCVNVTGVGINESGNDQLIQIYPNPTSGLFTVNYFNNENQRVDLSVINIAGELIGTWSFVNTIKLDLHEQAKGIYFVQLKTKQGVTTRKLLLQ
ncbi:MAG: T9SS type A sorting domain-containing protein [Flavobacteriales bacterium]|nr:T9SS type A sorting domain-containing protein [Flavobacteriales bacterium]